MTCIYYNGVDNFLFRQLMRRAGITHACLSFVYAKRTPKAKWFNDLEFLDGLMVQPGLTHLDDLSLEEYAEFLNKYSSIINYAIVPREALEELAAVVEEVELLPLYYSTYKVDTPDCALFGKALKETFVKPHIANMLGSGSYVHGFNVGIPETWGALKLSSVNTSSWLSGRYGTMFYFDGKSFRMYSKYDAGKYLVYAARKLRDLGYYVDLDLIKKKDGSEVAFMNLVYWNLYERSLHG
jgi:hypothetical protein